MLSFHPGTATRDGYEAAQVRAQNAERTSDLRGRHEPVVIRLEPHPSQQRLNELNRNEQCLAEWRRRAIELSHSWRSAWRDSGFDSPAVTVAFEGLIAAITAERTAANDELMALISEMAKGTK